MILKFNQNYSQIRIIFNDNAIIYKLLSTYYNIIIQILRYNIYNLGTNLDLFLNDYQ